MVYKAAHVTLEQDRRAQGAARRDGQGPRGRAALHPGGAGGHLDRPREHHRHQRLRALPDGSVYFVMEYLDGRPLADADQARRLDPDGRRGAHRAADRAARSARRTRAASSTATSSPTTSTSCHARRADDLREGARLRHRQGRRRLQQADAHRHGVRHAPLHVARAGGGQSVDARTDIYALGVIMYEMFTGRVPFDADTFMGMLTKHMFEKPAPMNVPGAGSMLGAIEQITLRALEKKPETSLPDRWTSWSPISTRWWAAAARLSAAPAAAVGGARRRARAQIAQRDEPRAAQPGSHRSRHLRGPPWRWAAAGVAHRRLDARRHRVRLLAQRARPAPWRRPVRPVPAPRQACRAKRSPAERRARQTRSCRALVPPTRLGDAEAISAWSASRVARPLVMDGAIFGYTPAQFPRPESGSRDSSSCASRAICRRPCASQPDSPERVTRSCAQAVAASRGLGAKLLRQPRRRVSAPQPSRLRCAARSRARARCSTPGELTESRALRRRGSPFPCARRSCRGPRPRCRPCLRR